MLLTCINKSRRSCINARQRDVTLQNRACWYRNLFILLVSSRLRSSDIALRGRWEGEFSAHTERRLFAALAGILFANSVFRVRKVFIDLLCATMLRDSMRKYKKNLIEVNIIYGFCISVSMRNRYTRLFYRRNYKIFNSMSCITHK